MAAKALQRLSRDAIVDLALQWIDSTSPYLTENRVSYEADEEDYLHVPAADISTLRTIWAKLRHDTDGFTKRDLIDRIVDGDWRRGLSLYQHAMIDMAFLESNDTALRWSALELIPLEPSKSKSTQEYETEKGRKRRKLSHDACEPAYPQISATTFLATLNSEISPLVKAHSYLHHLKQPYDISIIRLYISPNSTFTPRGYRKPRRAKHATDAARVMYIALPRSCPYVYVSVSGSASSSTRSRSLRDSRSALRSKLDLAATKKIILEAIPKALSRPHQRWALGSTRLTARSLHSITSLKGSGRPGTGGGAYSGYHKREHLQSISANIIPRQTEQQVESRTRETVEARFGPSAVSDHAALDRFHVTIHDARSLSPDQDPEVVDDSAARINLSFSGSDVFLGLRHLAELGPVQMELAKVPSWMTGEMGVSSLKT